MILQKGQIYTDDKIDYEIISADGNSVRYKIGRNEFTISRQTFDDMIHGGNPKIPFRIKYKSAKSA